jgi:membrane associated rhomboid family serine protease
MPYHEQSEDYRPLFWMQGRPIYVTTLLIILHIVAFVTTALAISFWGPLTVDMLYLDTNRVLYYGQVWRLFSYIIFPPSLWFVFAMGFLFFAGREVEQFVGRNTYIKLYLALIFIPAILLCLVGLGWPQQHLGGTESVFGVFVAFATIYPGVVLNIWFVNLNAKGWAWVLLTVYSLIDVASHQWSGLLVLWACGGVGYFGMRLVGAGRGMAWLTDWLEERRAKKLIQRHNFKIVKDKKTTESIDAILDKISKKGVGSLDAQERAALERARTKLLQRDEQ